MNEITIIPHGNINVVDSRQVAEMVGKQHAHLMRDIAGYIENMKNSTESNFGLSDFFLSSTYQDSTGRTLPCYLLTKKGCDMVANKMTGPKGTVFTATYVTAFEAMREHIETGKPIPGHVSLRDKAMEINAKVRAFKSLRSLWNQAGVDPKYQALALNNYFPGLELPRMAFTSPVPASVMLEAHEMPTLTKSQIALHLGIWSKKSTYPNATVVGIIIDSLKLEDWECKLAPFSNNGHIGTSPLYTQSVENKVRQWLEDHNWPSSILHPKTKRNYGIRYCQRAA